ncbi:MAG: ABC transporter permease subunit [Anaerolineaceae bacterium]|nr:MAG: ABC transporter permease subunit [Anaerolineaceae bacterium]
MTVIDGNEQKRIAASALSYAEIPWYRDIRVLRALAQFVFAVLALLAGVLIVNNLVSNLSSSNIPINFGIFRAPFSVALPEGPSMTVTWEWLQDTQTIQAGVTFVYVFLFSVILYSLWQKREGLKVALLTLRQGFLITLTLLSSRRQKQLATQKKEIVARPPGTPPKTVEADYVNAVLLVGLLIALIAFVQYLPPSRMPEELNRYLQGGSMSRAFITGVANTLRVVVFSLIACTILGVLAGIGLLSQNFVVRTTSKVFVEIFRNTPLAVQLLFVYRLLTQVLPRPLDSIYSSNTFTFIPQGSELYAINTRGLYLASPQTTDQSWIFLLCLVIAFAIAFFIRRRRLKHQDETGEPAYVFRYTVGVWAVAILVGWVLSGGWPLGGAGPFSISHPVLEGRQIAGGTHLTTAFFALFIGLTLYTGAFIAEIVRAGIQSVPYGQIEAARSQGFSGAQVLQLIVLPQALRLIIPPLGNQYVNLGKNSSLGIIVTYVDVYRVASLANNESGQAVPFFVALMVIYLSISLILSVLTNFVNRSTQLKTR